VVIVILDLAVVGVASFSSCCTMTVNSRAVISYSLDVVVYNHQIDYQFCSTEHSHINIPIVQLTI